MSASKKPIKTFVCLDTNILFRIVTQGRPGCEFADFEELKKLVHEGKVTFLLPEVVCLEFESLISHLEDDYKFHRDKIETALKKHLEAEKEEKSDKRWNEFDDFVPFIETKTVEWMQTKWKESNDRLGEVQKWLVSNKPQLLRMTQEIHFKATLRILAGRFPKRDARPIADCSIIETLIESFCNQEEDEQLLLCTENLQDFGVELENGETAIHPSLSDGLPPTEIFTTLSALVAACNKQKKVEPPPPEQVKDAVKRETNKDVQRTFKKEEMLRRLLAASEASQAKFRVFPEFVDTSGFAEVAREAAEMYKNPNEYLNISPDIASAARGFSELTKQLDLVGAREALRQSDELRRQLDLSGAMDAIRQFQEFKKQFDSSGASEMLRQAAEAKKRLEG